MYEHVCMRAVVTRLSSYSLSSYESHHYSDKQIPVDWQNNTRKTVLDRR